jgi:DNA-binding transcriptional MerR regulator
MKNKEVIKGDITFVEACKILGKSERTLNRYIRKGLITPEKN